MNYMDKTKLRRHKMKSITIMIALMLIAVPLTSASMFEAEDYFGPTMTIPMNLFFKMMTIIIGLTADVQYWEMMYENKECSSSSSAPVHSPIEEEFVCEMNLDFNEDGVINPLDIAGSKEIKQIILDGTQDMRYDCNCDGVVNTLDIGPCKDKLKTALVS